MSYITRILMDELEVLKIVVKKLESASIPYMVTGSIAANFYTTPRMTRDIDIVIEVEEKDGEKLSSLFSDGFYLDKDSLRNAIHLKKIFNIIHNEALVKIDFIIRKDIGYRKIEFDRRRNIDFEGTHIAIVSPEDLILSKLYWAKESISEMQLRDVKNLFMSIAGLDIAYIEKWVTELELEQVYHEVKK